MAGVFAVEGFGFPSNYNGSFLTPAALSAMQAVAATNANSIQLAPRIFMQTKTSNDVIADPKRRKVMPISQPRPPTRTRLVFR